MPFFATSTRDRVLTGLAALFIAGYFLLFSYHSLFTQFTFDDGMAILPFHHQFEKSIWTNVVETLKVFTNANRPVGAFIYRPLYRIFGFNPLPVRIVLYILMAINIWLAYRWARALDASKEAAALSTLLFCYNGSMEDLYYNSATMYDLLCFFFYIGAMLVYIRGRSAGNPLSARRIIYVVLLFLLALDSKEMAVTLPGTLLLFEIVYRRRDLLLRTIRLRSGVLLALMFVASGAFLKVKVVHLGHVSAYGTHTSSSFVLAGIGNYLEQLLYLKKFAGTPLVACSILAGLLAVALLLRSRPAVFGVLFFIAAIFPVAVIPVRGGYAAYVAFPGLVLAIGSTLAEARSRLMRTLKLERWQLASAVVLFLCVSVVHAKAQAAKRQDGMGTMAWDQARRLSFLQGFKRAFPEFPPNARVLITRDCWGPDWGPMFLARLLFHNSTLWVDRTNNMDHPPDLASYDVLVDFKETNVDMSPATLFGIKLPWEIRGYDGGGSEFKVSAPNPNRVVPAIEFSPPAVRAGRPVRVSAPGLANTRIDVLYRVLSGGHSRTEVVGAWCTLDDKGVGLITAPALGQVAELVVDWIRPLNERWIYTSGVLTVVE